MPRTKKQNTVESPKLSTAEQFYIEQHAGQKSAPELAETLGVPEDLVEAHLVQVAKDEPQRFLPIKAAMVESKGCVIMTQAASEIGDAATKNRNVSMEMQIQQAAKLGDYAKADRLTNEMERNTPRPDLVMMEKDGLYLIDPKKKGF